MVDFGVLFVFMIVIGGTDLLLEAACDRFPNVNRMINKLIGMELTEEDKENV